ncbi:hypothetical protein GCK32_010567 [Trichostrongylus colubriformis]|uniref:Secreted protein n=1 Tax=Trichostrongylus colubriformis TaxID=6319 RepID=A0AAN8EQ75_TRICO
MHFFYFLVFAFVIALHNGVVSSVEMAEAAVSDDTTDPYSTQFENDIEDPLSVKFENDIEPEEKYLTETTV